MEYKCHVSNLWCLKIVQETWEAKKALLLFKNIFPLDCVLTYRCSISCLSFWSRVRGLLTSPAITELQHFNAPPLKKKNGLFVVFVFVLRLQISYECSSKARESFINFYSSMLKTLVAEAPTVGSSESKYRKVEN